MTKPRSPNYPAISLGEAIEGVRKIQQVEHTAAMSRETAAHHLGYKSLSGASIPVLSALLKYGLLEGRGDSIKVSQDALAILFPADDPEAASAAMRRAALAPALFAELHERFPDGMPSEGNLASFLIKRGFKAKAASAASRSYRETMQLVSEPGEDYSSPMTGAEPQVVTASARGRATSEARATAVVTPVGEREWQAWTLADGRKIRLVYSGPDLTQPVVGKLIKYLEMAQEDLPKALEASEPADSES